MAPVTTLGTNKARLGKRGSVAIEFALIAPVIFVLMLGAVEVINAFRAQAKVQVMAGQLAELVAGTAAVTAPGGSLADYCTWAALNLLPYSTSAVSAQIASISVDHPINRVSGSTDSTTVQAYLDWENDTACPQPASTSLGLNGAFAAANQQLSMLTKSGTPAAATNDASLTFGYSAVVVAVQYNYSNAVTFFLNRLLSFSGIAVVRPRANATITCTNVAGTTPCPLVQ